MNRVAIFTVNIPHTGNGLTAHGSLMRIDWPTARNAIPYSTELTRIMAEQVEPTTLTGGLQKEAAHRDIDMLVFTRDSG